MYEINWPLNIVTILLDQYKIEGNIKTKEIKPNLLPQAILLFD